MKNKFYVNEKGDICHSSLGYPLKDYICHYRIEGSKNGYSKGKLIDSSKVAKGIIDQYGNYIYEKEKAKQNERKEKLDAVRRRQERNKSFDVNSAIQRSNPNADPIYNYGISKKRTNLFGKNLADKTRKNYDYDVYGKDKKGKNIYKYNMLTPNKTIISKDLVDEVAKEGSTPKKKSNKLLVKYRVKKAQALGALDELGNNIKTKASSMKSSISDKLKELKKKAQENKKNRQIFRLQGGNL